MKKRTDRQWIGVILAILLMLNIVKPINLLAATQDVDPKATVYRVYEAGTQKSLSPQKGDRVDIYVTIKDTKLKASDLKGMEDSISAIKKKDSFEVMDSEKAQLVNGIKNYGDNGIVFQIKFSNLKYTGSDDILLFDFSYPFSKTKEIRLHVPNCVEYNYSDHTGTVPKIEVRSIEFPGTIQGGDTFDVEFQAVCNIKDVIFKNVELDYSNVSSGLETTSVVDTKKFPNFKSEGPNTTQITLKAKKTLENDFETVTLKYTYSYRQNGEWLNDKSNEVRIKIPVVKNKSSDEKEDDKKASPYIIVDRYDYGEEAKPNSNVTVTSVLKNISKVYDVENVVVSFTETDGLISKEASNKFFIDQLKKGKEYKKDLTFFVNKGTTTGFQTVTLEITYDYIHDKKRESKTVTETMKIAVKSQKKKKEVNMKGSPYLIIDQYDYGEEVKAGSEFTINSVLKNMSRQYDLRNIVIVFSETEGLVSKEASNKLFIDRLKKGEKKTEQLHFLVNKDIATGFQTITFEMTYDYIDGQKRESKTVTETMKVAVKAKKKKKGQKSSVTKRTPAVMISKYEYGGKVPAGKTFTLDMSLKNTSKELDIENLIVSLEVAEGLSITSSSNTFYFDTLKANGSAKQTIEMQALPNAKSVSTNVTVNFKYEYVDKKQRTSVTSSEVIAIPIYQPDRMKITMGEWPETINVGEETGLSLQYVNKGKSSLYNLSAELKGDLTTTEKIQNLGNVDSGNSGSIDFYVTAQKAGVAKGKIVVTYEDDNLETKKVVLPYEIKAEEVVQDPMMDGGMDPNFDPNNNLEEGEKKSIPVKPLAILVGSCVGGGVFLFVRRKRKKATAKLLEELEEMDDER